MLNSRLLVFQFMFLGGWQKWKWLEKYAKTQQTRFFLATVLFFWQGCTKVQSNNYYLLHKYVHVGIVRYINECEVERVRKRCACEQLREQLHMWTGAKTRDQCKYLTTKSALPKHFERNSNMSLVNTSRPKPQTAYVTMKKQWLWVWFWQ